MRDYSIQAKNIKNPIYPAKIDMGGCNDKGVKLDLSNYFVQVDEKPFFAVCGEAHFSRINEQHWENEIIKMKMGGINIAATYLFWNHHEEIEGQFDWSGNKNIRKYVELCMKHDMYVILRVGPFCHGEVRNGGFPDWLFGRPFDIREEDERYLHYVRILFNEIGKQVNGLMYKDGGPVIGIQIENEHEHASAPWEMTTENSKEWVVSGRQGPEHMATLKRLAMEAGLVTPLYTATAWGGACAPVETVLPLWGGYAFRPWIFYGDIKEHPATQEYLYGDFHCNTAPKYYNFDPEYPAEDLPYACCEMGGGMNVYYKYRFQLPYESVGAMSMVKVASGCNFLGYYMYHGGTNPKGKLTPYLNENAVPKFSYDYQAAIGEFGQIRKSYQQLKLMHLFYKKFENQFAYTKTVLSEEAKRQVAEDVETLRYAVRMDEAGSGYLFINNYQDHVDTIVQKDFSVLVEIDNESIRVPEAGYLDIEKDCFGILPINFNMEGTLLKYATAQLITKMDYEGASYYFFTKVKGMKAEYKFDSSTIIKIVTADAVIKDGTIELHNNNSIHMIELIDSNNHKIFICTLSDEEALKLWSFEYQGKERIVLSDASVLPNKDFIAVEYSSDSEYEIKVFPPVGIVTLDHGVNIMKKDKEEIFEVYQLGHVENKISFTMEECSTKNSEGDTILKRPVVGSPITSMKIVNARAIVKVDPSSFEGYRQLRLQVNYEGDIGYAFINGEMIHDNFSNGDTWEFDLVPFKDKLVDNELYIYISPKKKGSYVDSTSTMAARFEVSEEQIARLESIQIVGIEEAKIDLK